MRYIAAAASDIGRRHTNQDSLCVKIAKLDGKEDIVMALMCDGMGGLSKGELASASLIHAFSAWFDDELPKGNMPLTLAYVMEEWRKVLEVQSRRFHKYERDKHIKLGTTFSGLFILNDEYMTMQIGDSRIYCVFDDVVKQLTEDQTVAMQEYKLGNLSKEEALTDSRRNILLQCVGVTKHIKPVVTLGKIQEKSTFILCSDGQYHTLKKEDLFNLANPSRFHDLRALKDSCEILVRKAKERNEKDNISIIMIGGDFIG